MEIIFKDSVSSTNDILYREHPSEDTALVAFSQTQGKGRKGRQFYSPSDTGLYMSVILHPDCIVQDAIKLTTIMAVASCRALERYSTQTVGIKWVNDLYCNDKKIAGILTECSANIVNQKPDYVVVGIGVNVYPPKDGFPEDIAKKAGSLLKTSYNADTRRDIARSILQEFESMYETFPNTAYEREYIERSVLIGRKVQIVGGDVVTVIGIDDNLGLKVKDSNEKVITLTAGEVSLNLNNNE